MSKLSSPAAINIFAVVTVLLAAFLFFGFRGETVSRAQDALTPSAIRFSENFDNVAAPALPVGWTTSRTGSNALFVTTTVSPETPPNALFTDNPPTAGSAEVTSPNITLGNTKSRLTFRHRFQTETRPGFDGGVLEISVNGGEFQDILTAGATFIAGGYLQPIINSATGNPLIGRQSWTGDSNGYVTTIVELPLSLANQNIRLRWRLGTNDSLQGNGWRIDKITVEDRVPTVVRYSENFDGVFAPNIPPDWTIESTDVARNFRTNTERSFTQPNAVFTPALATAGSSAIISPPISIGNNAPKLIFQHSFATDLTSEGGVLEISINGGSFQDIVSAGGSFAHGGYTGTLRTATGNPLENRQAWTGSTTGFIITEVNLPPEAYNQSVRFKWVFGTDSVLLSIGWWIDSVQVTENLSGENISAIAIPESGAAQPFPAEIQVENHPGLIRSVRVSIINFTHTSPDDVDLMLVAPNGRKVVLMSDVGGSFPANNLSLTFDDLAGVSLPDSGQLFSGRFKPTNFEAGDSFPAPAPNDLPIGNTLGFFNGSPANGVWKLFLVDDNGNNAGSISGGWNLDVQTSQNVIAIPASGAAQPFPAEFNVSGIPGAVSKVTVNLTNFSHTAPDDVDLMLVSPNGRRVVIMSDVGGNTEVGSLNITLDDDAPLSLPDNEPLTSGAFKPTNFEPGDAFPAPAPQSPPSGNALNAFFGGSPNGVWKLYVVDDTGENFGSISGNFSLNIESSLSACYFDLSHTIQAFPVTGGSGSFGITIPSTCPWEVSSLSNFVTVTSTASGEGNGIITYNVAPNMEGGRTGSISVSAGGFTRIFSIQQPSGCPFSISQTFVNFTGAGGSASIPVTAGGTCNWTGETNASWIQINSPPQNGNGNLAFTVQPNTSAASRSGTITIGARQITVNQTAQSATKFDFDRDGKADIAVFRPSAGIWYLQRSTAGFTGINFGIETDKIVPADYDGDGRTDVAVFRNGIWYLLRSQLGFTAVNFGQAGDIPVPADYDGDGRADPAVFRGGVWYVLQSSNNQFRAEQFGLASDKVVPADYDGDGKTDIAVFRDGNWYILRSQLGVTTVQFGIAADKPIAADYDGDGRADQAVYRNGFWYLLRSQTGFAAIQFGIDNDIVVPADYDGDAKADLAVYRNGTWFLLQSTNGFAAIQFGVSSDKPVPGAFQP